MKRLLSLLIIAFVSVSMAFGKSFYYNGINYNTISSNTVEVISTASNESYYFDAITIPRIVMDEGKAYKVVSIGDAAFSFSTGLTSITIPNSITSIGDDAFFFCIGLTSITIPNSITSIGDNAFSSCSRLTSITIPSRITTIEKGVFSGCSGLTSITIPNSVKKIGENAFHNCRGLTSITIPNSITSIGDYAFSDCVGLTSITIPNSITSIEKGVFSGCIGLTSIPIPNSVTSIGDHAFSGCSGLTSITIPNSVTSIGDGTFGDCRGLTSISIPNSVTSIGDHAFSGCSGLTSITIPNSVTSISDGAFAYCSGLTSITIPNSVTSIGYGAFSGCSCLTSITIPNSVTSIGHDAFNGCIGLTSIIIPNSITSIGYYAFNGCVGLTSISIPNSVTSIEKGVFSGCSGLTSITIPNSVTSIWDYAFSGCSGLTTITIGKSVTSIGKNAFYGCSRLAYVTSLNTTPPKLETNTFSDYNATLYVPTGCKTVYESRQFWSKFTRIVEIDVANIQYTLTYLVDGEVYKTYKLKAGDKITPESEPTKEGYTFSGWSEVPSTMPDHDVIVSGTFTPNEPSQYTLTYLVDGEVYKTYKLKVGETITPEAEPTKEGYTFSGWSEIPSTMPDHDVTVSGTFTKNGSGTDDDNPSNYKSLDDYIANSNTTLQNNNYTINPIIKNIKKVYIDLTKGTTNSAYCYIPICNENNAKRIDFSSKYLQSTSTDNLVIDNNTRRAIKNVANNKTYSWLYYNPQNSNEVIIDVEAYFGCVGHINGWQRYFGTSCIVNIVTESTETSVIPIESDSEDKDNKYYNLQGQRVLYPRNGIYIKNGKKIFIK